MLEKQIEALKTILENEDLQAYAGSAFWNLIHAVVTADAFDSIAAAKDVKELVFHMPTILFWDKMKRYLLGTFSDYGDQVKLAAKFNGDHEKYTAFVKKQIHLINSIDDDLKVDYFAALTRCFLLTDLEQPLFFKLSKFLISSTPEELEFIKNCPENYASPNTAMISFLYQYGLFTQDEKGDVSGETCYVLSDIAKALKQDCLNFDAELNGDTRIIRYEQLAPLNILESASNLEFEEILGNI